VWEQVRKGSGEQSIVIRLCLDFGDSIVQLLHSLIDVSDVIFYICVPSGQERKGSGERSIALGYPQILGIQLRSFYILDRCE